MKKTIAVVLTVFMWLGLAGVDAYAGGWVPGNNCGEQSKNALECGLIAYQQCADEFKVWNPTGGPDGTGSYTLSISPQSAQFKACESFNKQNCMTSRGC